MFINLFQRKKDTIVFGATGQAILLRPLLEEQGYNIIALFDKAAGRPLASPFANIPLWREASYKNYIRKWDECNQRGKLHFILAMCHPWGNRRLQLHDDLLQRYCRPTTIIDPTARIAKDAFIRSGVQVLANACIMERAIIGKQCIINCGSIVHHECVLEPGSEVGPGAILCGFVRLGVNSKIGAGATILPKIKIGSNSIVGAGSVVTHDVPNNVVVMGNPARVYKEDYLKNV